VAGSSSGGSDSGAILRILGISTFPGGLDERLIQLKKGSGQDGKSPRSISASPHGEELSRTEPFLGLGGKHTIGFLRSPLELSKIPAKGTALFPGELFKGRKNSHSVST